MKRCFVILILVGLTVCVGRAQGYFDFTSSLQKAYNLSLELRCQESRALLAEIKKTSPENLIVDLVADYNDFFELFITEDEARFHELAKNKEARMKRLNKGDKSSPYYLFAKAEIHLHWAAVRLKFEENFTAAREIYSAYHLLEENVRKFPSFKANKKSLSIIYALAESVPAWVRSIVGIKGSIKLGTDESRRLVAHARSNPDFLFSEECYAIYAYILLYQNNNKEEAYRILNQASDSMVKSPLLTFLKANVAQKNGYNDLAITLLENRSKHPKSLPFYYLDFMLGKFKLYRLEKGADADIRRFTSTFGGKHFVKEAYQKLAWYELVVNGDISAYKSELRKAKNHGSRLTDEDKQAEYEGTQDEVPEKILMKSRLLFDGGYYDKALKVLKGKEAEYLPSSPSYSVYNYRLGRIYQRMRYYNEALYHYGVVIGLDEHNFFHCSSLYNSGLIHERQKNGNLAKAFFKKTLAIHPERYKQSIHSKAKTGLKRISEK